MISQISRMVSSKTPCVDGYVTISAARSFLCASALARKSATSMLPFASHATATTFIPAMAALAGIGAVRGSGNQADVAMRLAARFVILANDQQAGVFALRAGVGLQAKCRRSR